MTTSAAPDFAASLPPVTGPTPQPDPPPSPQAGDDAPPVPRDVPLPSIQTTLQPDQILEKLSFASRRGRLAGFHSSPATGLFSVDAFGQPFDRLLIADVRKSASGTTLDFRTTLPMKWPGIFIAVTLFTIWPGVWLTDSLLSTYFSSYPWFGDPKWEWGGMHVQTLIWYLPLTVLPLPWVCRSLWRKSEAASHDSAHRAIRKIAAEVGGTVA